MYLLYITDDQSTGSKTPRNMSMVSCPVFRVWLFSVDEENHLSTFPVEKFKMASLN